MALNPYDETLNELDEQKQTGPAPAAPVNPYLETLNQLDQGRERNLRQSIIGAEKTTPDRAGEAIRLSQRTGLPVSVIERNFEAIQQRAKIADTPYSQMLKETPVLAAYVSEAPEQAAVVQDDMEQLGYLEWLTQAPARAYQRGQAQVRFGQLSAASMFRSLTAQEREQLKADKAKMSEGGALGAGESWFKGAITASAQQLPNLFGAFLQGAKRGIPFGVTAGTAAAMAGQAGPQFALPEEVVTVPMAFAGGFTAGTMTGGAEFGFMLEAGLALDEYNDFKDELGQPLDPDVAKAAALATGALNAGLEAVGLGALLKSFPGMKKLMGSSARAAVKNALRNPSLRSSLGQAMKTYGATLATETSVEMGQRLVTIMAGELAKVASGQTIAARPAGEIAADIANEGAHALQAFALLSLPGPGMSVVTDTVKARSAKHNAAFFTALGDGVTNSKTVQRMPEAAQEFLARATKDGPLETIYAPVKAWSQYWQSEGLDPREVAIELTGDGAAYDNALATGEDLPIPTARYAVKVAGTKHNAALMPELRLGADEMNLREAEAFEEQLKAQAGTETTEAPASGVRTAILTELANVGLPTETAQQYATLYESVFGSIAARAGVDPVALFRQYGLQVVREGLQDVAAAPTVAPAGMEAGLSVPAPSAPSTVPGAAPAAVQGEGATAGPGQSSDVATGSEGAPAPSTGPLSPLDVEAGVREALGDLQDAPEVATLPVSGEEGTDPTGDQSGTLRAGDPASGLGLRDVNPQSGQADAFGGADAAGRRDGAPARGSLDIPAAHVEHFTELLTDARANGFTGSDDSLADVFLRALDDAEAAARDLNSSDSDGPTSFDLLKAISKAGGFGIEEEAGPDFVYRRGKIVGAGGMVGELENLLESLTKQGQGKRQDGRRIPIQFRQVGKLPGGKPNEHVIKRKGGNSADRVLEAINEDGRWSFENLADFMEAVRDAVMIEMGQMQAPGTGKYSALDILANVFDVRPGVTWWEESGIPTDSLGFPDSPSDAAGAEFNQDTVPAFPELFDLWEAYDTDGTDTPDDLAASVEHLLDEGDAPESLRTALEAFRDEQADNRDLYGDRGGNEAEEAFVAAVQAVANRVTRATALAPVKKESLMWVQVGNATYPIKSLAEASKGMQAAINILNTGARDTPTALVFRDGEQIGFVAYNGRIVEGTPQTWTPAAKMLYDPFAKQLTAQEPELVNDIPDGTIETFEDSKAADRRAAFDLEFPPGSPERKEWQELYDLTNSPDFSGFDPDWFPHLIFDEFGEPHPRRSDTLSTGEQQPRLPAAGAVRDLEVAQPTLFDIEEEFKLTAPPETDPTQTTLFQAGFHGSPHIFDKFELHAVGTGEGAEAYGWGLYFASRREVADWYRDRLSRNGAARFDISDGTQVTWEEVRRAVADAAEGDENDPQLWQRAYDWIGSILVRMTGGAGQAPTDLNTALMGFGVALRERAENAQEELDKMDPDSDDRSFVLEYINRVSFWPRFEAAVRKVQPTKVARPGRTYKVEIPDDHLYLNWDVPAASQTEEVQAALRELGLTWDQPGKMPLLVELEDVIIRAMNGLGGVPPAATGSVEAEALRVGLNTVRIVRSARGKGIDDVISQAWEKRLTDWWDEHKGFVAGVRSDAVERSGESIYNWLSFEEKFSERAKPSDKSPEQLASERLAAVGIAGIKYKDGFSRAQLDLDKAAHNYVVFDDSAVQIVEYDQPLFHGTPHDFDRFSLDKIGTGEGALAYGWGLYFAESKEVAEGYRKRLTDYSAPTRYYLNGVEMQEGPERHAAALLAHGELKEVRRTTKAWIKEQADGSLGMDDTARQAGIEPVEYWRRLHEFTLTHTKRDIEKRQGRLYQVEINDDAIAKMIDHDGEFGDQPVVVQEMVRDILKELRYLRPNDNGPRVLRSAFRSYVMERGRIGSNKMTGMLMYDMFVQAEQERAKATGNEITQTEAMKEASLRLAAAGVPGIRYFDGDSRGKRKGGTRNVVAFDDSIVTVTHKDGTPVSTGERAEMMREMFQDVEDYGGLHRPPGVEDGAPAHDLTGDGKVYPDDVYSANGPRYYGTGEPGMDSQTFATVLSLKGRPNAAVTIYRAVPRPRLSTDQRIAKLEDEKRYMQKHGRIPPTASLETTAANSSAYYDQVHAEIERLRAEPAVEAGSKPVINAGDWVTVNRQYAKEHGEGPLRGDYVIIRRTVKARDIYTNGDSIHEWGYWPQTAPTKTTAKKVLAQLKRGSIKFGRDRQMMISLFQHADLSTFLHESGHFYLEVFGDVVDEISKVAADKRTPEQQKMVADYETLLGWFGVDRRTAIGREQHEQFARGFEAYLMRGESPDVALNGAFSRFRAWLLGVYRSMKALNVELSDEVVAVFDRLVATDTAIQQAEQLAGVQPMFLTPEAAGMSEEEFRLYRSTVEAASRTAREQLDAKLMREVQRELTAEWKARRSEVEATVTNEVHERPIYQAMAAMQKGTTPAGSPLLEGMEPEPLKLSKATIVARYGADRLKTLPKPYIYTADGGMDPDIVADMFGFSSGDELLRTIATTQPMKTAIDEETDRRMLAEHGAILLDGTLHEKATAAMANEDRERIIRQEMRALGQLRRIAKPFVKAGEDQLKTERRERAYERRWLEAEAKLKVAIAQGEKQVEIDALRQEVRHLRQKARGGAATIRAAIPPDATIRNAARQRIAGMKVRQLNPAPFWSASRRAAQLAIEAAARGDFEGAITLKQQELLNLALYREASDAREDIETRVRKAKDLSKPAARSRLGPAGESYLDQVDGILDRYSFATVSQKVLDRRASLEKWIAEQEGEGMPIDLPEEVLNEVLRTPYQELTVEQLIGVTDGLDMIVHLARLKNRLLKAQSQRELDEVVEDMTAAIREHGPKRSRAQRRDRGPAAERRRLIGSFFASHRKIASLARQMDGFIDGGPVWEALIRPLNDAGDREAAMNATATKKLGDLINSAYPGASKSQLYVETYIPEIGTSLSKMHRIMVALNWGNEGNRQRVQASEKWDAAQVQAVLDGLTLADWQFVQGTLDMINSYWEEIAEKQKRVTGVAPTKVDAAPIDTKFGRFAGGYFPIKYDDRLSATAAAHLDLDAGLAAKQAAYVKATTRRGHTKERMTKTKLPLRLDFGVITEHLQAVIHDLTHHEALIDVSRVLQDRRVQTAIFETYGDVVYKQFKESLKDIALGDVPATNGFEKSMNHLRTGATIAGLGWNLTTALLQPLGLTQSMVRIGPRWVGRGLSRWLRNPGSMVETVNWITDKSTFMANRGRTQQREINELRNQIGMNTGKLGGWVDEAFRRTTFNTVTRQGIADSYFFLIQQLQRVVDVPTWLGAYEKSMAADGDEGRAIALADQAVLDAQAGGQIKDLAGVQRGGPLLKLWTNFYSFFNTTYNLTVESTRRTKFSHPGEVGRLAVDYMLLYIVPASMGFFVRAAMKGDLPEDEEELLEGLVRENLGYLSGTMLGVRELGGTIQGFQGYEGPAGARGFAALARFGSQVQQGEADAAFWRALNDAAGILFHYPAGQVRRTIEGSVALAEGEADNPFVVVGGPPREQ